MIAALTLQNGRITTMYILLDRARLARLGLTDFDSRLMTGLESTKLPEPSLEPFLSPSGANARSVKPSNPKVHRIDPGTLTGRVFGGFGVKHERTTELGRWAAAY